MARRYKDAPSILQDEKECFLSGSLEGLERHHGLNGRAVGVCDDALVLILRDGMRVDLRHHERDFRVHAPGAGVIDDHRTGGGYDRCKNLGGTAARGEKRDVNAKILKRILGQLTDGVFFAHELDGSARAACRGKEEVFRRRKFTLFQYAEEHSADHPCGADNCDLVLFHVALVFAILTSRSAPFL